MTQLHLYRDKNDALWIGTNKGVWRHDESTSRNYTTADGLPANWLSSAASTSEGKVWFASARAASQFDGTNFFNLSADQLTGRTNSPTNQGSTWLRDVFVADDGAMWFGLQNFGATRWDGTNISRITTNGLVRFDRARDGTLWFSWVSRSGPTVLDRAVLRHDGQSFTRLSLAELSLTNTVNRVHCDPKGNIWFGSTEGLVRYDGMNFTRLSKEQGLVDDYVRAISSDPDGTI